MSMKRRALLQCVLAVLAHHRARGAAAEPGGRFDEAAGVLERAVASNQVSAAALHVMHGDAKFSWRFPRALAEEAMFLLGSITKPMCMTALMTLYDAGEFKLDDPVRKFIPRFAGEGRDETTLRHLLTHTSGLPDQLPENAALRARHAPLSEFVEHALALPPGFRPGARYQYSSMGILLAAHVAERISGVEIRQFVERAVFQPLGMKHSALGLGRFARDQMVDCQTERAAPEAGGGDPAARNWDWNSPYWRALGAPWGGAHCSAADVGRFLEEFLRRRGNAVSAATAELMVTNQNPAGLVPRGLGFNVGAGAGSPGCSDQTFGHTGSTGTLCWADPATQTICVVLTSLPSGAANPHPRELAAARVATCMKPPGC